MKLFLGQGQQQVGRVTGRPLGVPHSGLPRVSGWAPMRPWKMLRETQA